MTELNVFSTFPITDTYSILSGDTLFDFIRGIVTLSDGTVVPMARRSVEDQPLRFLWIDCASDVNVEVRYRGEIQYKGRVASDGFYFENMYYDEVIIITTATTATQVIGSSSSIGGVGGSGGTTGADIETVEADIDGKEALTTNSLGYGRTSAGVTHPIKVNNAGEIIINTGGATSVGDNRQVVTSHGTAVALAASTTIKEVTVTAETDNTDIVVVGGSTVVAALATRRGNPLYPSDSFTIEADNLAEVFIDSLIDGEGVTFTYLA